MDPPYALGGHPRSMSSLVTILPLSLNGPDWRPPTASPRQPRFSLDAAHVPLPSSVSGSEHDSWSSDVEKWNRDGERKAEDVRRHKDTPKRSSESESRNSDPEKRTIHIRRSVHVQDRSSDQEIRGDVPAIIGRLPEATEIPLPPSETGSEDAEEPAAKARSRTDWPDPDRIPLPPSVAGSEYEQSPVNSRRASLLSIVPDQATRRSNARVPATGEVQATQPASTFAELMTLVQQARNERARIVDLRQELLELLHICGAHGRCLGVQSFLYKRLVECFRLEMKPAFVAMLEQMEASQAIYPSSSDPRRRNLAVPSASEQQQSVPWITTFPGHAQSALLKLLNNLRTNPAFLAERVSHLNNSQLKNLARPHLPTSRSESSTDSSPSNRLDLRLLRPWSRSSTPTFDGLSQDPLRLMILSCFDPTSVPGSSERRRLLDVWSTTCARLIEDQRTGSNEFCFAVLEVFADITPWELGPKLELFLLELMHTGAFITAGAVGPTERLKESSESSPGDVDALSAFFDRAVDGLLDLVSRSASFSIPSVALDLIHATLQKLDDPQRRTRARRFFVYVWYCNTFLSSALLFPERHRMLLNVHISTSVRQRLFRELAGRMQKTVRDVLDPKSSNPHPAGVEAKVAKLVSIFSEDLTQDNHAPTVVPFERPYIVLFAEDVLSITKALYPNDPSETTDPLTSEPTSPPSSITGSSTLTAGTNELRSGITSAFTPSVSGTSVTSHTLSSDFFLKSPDKTTDDAMANAAKSRPGTSSSFDAQVEHIPVHSFLSELWKLCASRKSSHSPLPTVDAAEFFIASASGHVDFQTSRNADGDLPIHALPEDAASNSLLSKDTRTIMRALAQASSEDGFHCHPKVVASSDAVSSIDAIFRLHLDQARCRHEFQSSFFWFHALKALANLSQSGTSLISDLSTRYTTALQANALGSQRYQEWLHSLQALGAAQACRLQHLATHGAALRSKMWYLTDVRNSDVYEHTVNVVKTLRNMSKPPVPKQHGVAAWARQRLRVSFGHEKAQAQAFELIAAPKTCGGPNKLTDHQAELVSRWLTRESIENFCGGEERMHRFCLEMQKCATKLVGVSMSDSPVLWSSALFSAGGNKPSKGTSAGSQARAEKAIQHRAGKVESPESPHLAPPGHLIGRTRGLGFAFDRPGGHAIPQLGQDHLADPFMEKSGARHDTWRSAPSPLNGIFPPSPVSPEANLDGGKSEKTGSGASVDHLRQSVVALLISDLGPELWGRGCETDAWINDAQTPLATAAALLQESTPDLSFSSTQHAGPGGAVADTNDPLIFDFGEGYQKLLTIFKHSLDPQQKLQALYELSILAECQCIAANDLAAPSASPDDDLPRGLSALVAQARGVPRIRLTRLQEVVANCNERRQASRAAAAHRHNPSSGSPDDVGPRFPFTSSARDVSAALVLVSSLFLDAAYRPATLFRDLQLIAAFVPAATLDATAHGAVFWTVGLVAMGLKVETCALMTRQAAAIVDWHVNSGSQGRSSSREPMRAGTSQDPHVNAPSAAKDAPPSAPPLSAADLARTTLADAARLYLLSALEGEPAAARELALFYLTHPELVRPAMLPLSRPGEVLRSIHLLGGAHGAERSNGGLFGGGSGQGEERRSAEGGVLDPPTFAVAYHWMEFAANAGDADALTFLRENRELAGDV